MQKLHVIAACGSGMGTSNLIKNIVSKILKSKNIDFTLEAMSAGSAKPFTNSVDIIICSKHLSSEFRTDQKAKIIGVKNLLSESEIREGLESVL